MQLRGITEEQILVIAINKTDNPDADIINIENTLRDIITTTTEITHISARQGTGIEQLEALLVKASGAADIAPGEIMVTNARHYEALTHAATAISRAIDGLSMGLSGDFIAQDIRETLHHLGEITGTITSQDILTTIFSRFCIGK